MISGTKGQYRSSNMKLRRAPFTVVALSWLIAACGGHQSTLTPSPSVARPFALQSNAPSPSPWQQEPNFGVFSQAVGADGHSIWGSGTGSGIGRLDIPTNTVQFFGGPGASWQAATAGPNGLMWYCDANDGDLHTVDDNGNIQTFSGAWGGCNAIEVGPDGNLWLSAFDVTIRQFEAYKVTPTGVATEYILPHGAGPVLIGGLLDGNVWYSEAASYVAKITASSGTITEYPLVYKHRYPQAFTAIDSGHDGNIYLIDSANLRILRLTETGTTRIYEIQPARNVAGGASAQSGYDVFTIFFGRSDSALYGWTTKGHVWTGYGTDPFFGHAVVPFQGPDMNIWTGDDVYLLRLLTVTPQSATISVGGNQPFSISETNCKDCIWSAVSEEPQIASVSPVSGNGFSVTGVSTGTAQIDVYDKRFNVVHVDVTVN